MVYRLPASSWSLTTPETPLFNRLTTEFAVLRIAIDCQIC
jgi:hypothetical protein